MQIFTFPLGPLDTNCYLAHNDLEAVVIDPGGDPGKIIKILKEQGLTLTHIFNTHLHLDHTYGNSALSAATGAKVFAGEAEKIIEDTELVKGGIFGLPEVEAYRWEAIAPGKYTILGTSCEILATPGHSPGSLCFYFASAKVAFVGDLIFLNGVGRTDFPGSSQDSLVNSIKTQIFTLPDDTVLYPGHGPATSVKKEKRSNPYV